MSSRICTFRDLWPARAARFPEKSEWVCVYIPRPGQSPLRRVIGPPGEASEKRAQSVLDQVARRKFAADTGLPLFGDYADRYLRAGMALHQLAKSTTAAQSYRVKILSKRWGTLRLDEINQPELVAWWEEQIVGKGLSMQTGRRWLSALSSVYRYAAQKGVSVQNPVRAFLPTVVGFEATKAGRAAQEETANPIEQAEKLAALDRALHELGDPDVYLLVLLMLDQGERRGEAFAARPMDMEPGESENDPRRLVWVRENRPMGLEPEAPKSGRVRAVPMSRRLRAHLREHYALWPTKKPLASRFTRGSDYFQRHLFPRITKKAGLGRRLPKDLRDTFASHLLTGGFPQIQIMRWMGHAPGSVAMFRRRYARWIGEENDWSYRPPVALAPGEVPTDILARLTFGDAARSTFAFAAAMQPAAARASRRRQEEG